MPIAFDCACGKPFSVADEYAGKRTKCPACGAPLTVPTPAAPESSPEDEAFRLLADGNEKEPEDEPPAPARRDPEPAAMAPPPPRPAPRPPAPAPKPAGPKLVVERKKREPRPYDPDAAKKWLYIIGGLFMIGGGGALAYFSVEGGRFSIRGMVGGCLLAFGGVGVLFQGITGKFDEGD